MLKITVPIYYKALVPNARKDALMGMNWYAHSNNVFKSNGRKNTVAALTKKKFNELIERYADEIREESTEDMSVAGNGYHVHYDVFVGRMGTDGHNVRSVIEKFCLDALEEAGLIENDKYVYTTSSAFYLERNNPRCEITITKLKDEHPYEIN